MPCSPVDLLNILFKLNEKKNNEICKTEFAAEKIEQFIIPPNIGEAFPITQDICN